MNPSKLIKKKRDGHELNVEEIQLFVDALQNGAMADYQVTSLLMAIFFQGLTFQETVALTSSMAKSGVQYDLSSIQGPKIDKHSTGGVGDKVSLILAPLAAACGLKVPMMSGRGLGHTGGTLDKLQAIPGFEILLSREKFDHVLANVGCVMIGQDEKIAPADKKLYSLRDVTGTVECIPLITSSILSKKIAEGTEGLVMDIKVGNGALMHTKKNARALGQMIVKVSKKLGLPCQAVITNMDQPLGYAVGNAVEVLECVEVMQGKRPFIEVPNNLTSSDLREVTVHLCAQMLILGKKVRTINEGRKMAQNALASGEVWKRFLLLVEAQGGSASTFDHPEKLLTGTTKHVIRSKKTGYLNAIQSEEMGYLLVEMGGGRKKVTDTIDPAVGFLLHRKLGSRVKTGDPLATLFVRNSADSAQFERLFLNTLEIHSARKPVPKLIQETLT